MPPGFQTGTPPRPLQASRPMSKLRDFETLGFRPQNEAQDRLIRDAQKATGLQMSDLLRRAVLIGLPNVVEEVRREHDTAFKTFANTLEESGEYRTRSRTK